MFSNPSAYFPMTGSLSSAGGLEEIQTIASRAENGAELGQEEVRKVGQKFEALLLHNLLSTMRESVGENPLFGKSHGEKMYWDLFDEAMADAAAQANSTGIGEVIVEEMMRQQSQVRPPSGDSPFRPLAPVNNPARPIDAEKYFRPIERERPELAPIDRNEKDFKPIPGRSAGGI